MKGVQVWDTDKNFWEVNPYFKLLKKYNNFYSLDKSKNKSTSSIVMWSICLLMDSSSMFKDMNLEDKKNMIILDFVKDRIKDFSFDNYTEYINEYNIFKSATQKQMDEWIRLMNEKTEYMKSLNYNRENAEHIEELLLSNTKLYNEYEKLKSKLESESDFGVVKGDQEESLSEKNII